MHARRLLQVLLLLTLHTSRAKRAPKPPPEALWNSTSCGLFNKTVPTYAHQTGFPLPLTPTSPQQAARPAPACAPLETIDVLRGWHKLAHPPLLDAPSSCRQPHTAQGLTVCSDVFAHPPLSPTAAAAAAATTVTTQSSTVTSTPNPPLCVVWSVIVSNFCDDMGSLGEGGLGGGGRGLGVGGVGGGGGGLERGIRGGKGHLVLTLVAPHKHTHTP